MRWHGCKGRNEFNVRISYSTGLKAKREREMTLVVEYLEEESSRDLWLMPCAPNLNSTSFFTNTGLLTQETGSPFPLLQLSQSHSSSDQTGLHCRTFIPSPRGPGLKALLLRVPFPSLQSLCEEKTKLRDSPPRPLLSDSRLRKPRLKVPNSLAQTQWVGIPSSAKPVSKPKSTQEGPLDLSKSQPIKDSPTESIIRVHPNDIKQKLILERMAK
ncbi:hypothetical protein HAX54_014963 [Datura stramonium]|uniref:Uncharacterized protein n=1 Tax=Datura stramonium TaxID=4076 RepID=A0ABS8Y6A8_DATST|nr:hypothetical protein [Datura stramonium]